MTKTLSEPLVDRIIKEILEIMYDVGVHDKTFGSYQKDVYVEQYQQMLINLIKQL